LITKLIDHVNERYTLSFNECLIFIFFLKKVAILKFLFKVTKPFLKQHKRLVFTRLDVILWTSCSQVFFCSTADQIAVLKTKNILNRLLIDIHDINLWLCLSWQVDTTYLLEDHVILIFFYVLYSQTQK